MKKKMRNSNSLSDKDKYLIVREGSRSGGDGSPNSITVRSLQDTDNAFRIFFESHTSYDLVPDSSKLVVLDKSLNVQKAFYALIYNGVRAALIWDGDSNRYEGMFTITDFIKILRNCYKEHGSNVEKFHELENENIELWRNSNRVKDSDLVELASVRPEDSLKCAVEALLRRRVHRCPVIDIENGNPLHIITHKRLLKYLYMNLYHLPCPSFMSKAIIDIPLGTYSNVQTISRNKSIIEAFDLFIQRRISALPVIDSETSQLVDIYSKFDAINLAMSRTYHELDRTIAEAIELRGKKFPHVVTCTKADTLQKVMDLFNSHEIHRLVIVDSHNKVEGIISLSDVLEYFIRDHPTSEQ